MVQCPAVTNHYNWWIGGAGANSSDLTMEPAIYDHDGTMVSPHSLYLEQLKERLGGAAVENIGYTLFSISNATGLRTTPAGGVATYTIAVGDPTLMSNTVGLSVGGLPSGVNATFSPSTVVGSGSAALTITTSAWTPAGNYTLNVAGTSAGLSHTNAAVLLVTPFLQPRFSSLTVSGNNLLFTGSNAASGTIWDLLQSTDLSAPLSQWQTDGTVVFDADGNFFTNFGNAATNTRAFYILRQ